MKVGEEAAEDKVDELFHITEEVEEMLRKKNLKLAERCGDMMGAEFDDFF